MPSETVLKVAAAIANARGMRRGVPEIVNILDVLPDKGSVRCRNKRLDVVCTNCYSGYMSTTEIKKYATVARFGFGNGNECSVESLHSTRDAAIRKAKSSRNNNGQYVLMALYSPDGFARGETKYYDYLAHCYVAVEVGGKELGGCEVIF